MHARVKCITGTHLHHIINIISSSIVTVINIIIVIAIVDAIITISVTIPIFCCCSYFSSLLLDANM